MLRGGEYFIVRRGILDTLLVACSRIQCSFQAVVALHGVFMQLRHYGRRNWGRRRHCSGGNVADTRRNVVITVESRCLGLLYITLLVPRQDIVAWGRGILENLVIWPNDDEGYVNTTKDRQLVRLFKKPCLTLRKSHGPVSLLGYGLDFDLASTHLVLCTIGVKSMEPI